MRTNKMMVAAAHPAAVDAGLQAMRDGGNALDSAVATAFTLAVVEPHASGIGGGGFLLYYEAKSREFYFLDFRETAPAGLTQDLYIDHDGLYTGRRMARGGASIGTPGMVKGLARAHETFGRLKFGVLLRKAIEAAEEGFAVTGYFRKILQEYQPVIGQDAALSALFMSEGGSLPPVGGIIRQPSIARTLCGIAEEGPAHLYDGRNARLIVEAARGAGGVLSLQDLRDFQPRVREPLRGNYRGYELVSAPPPSSGGWQVLEMLKLLEQFDLEAMRADSTACLALLASAMGRTGCVAERELGDPDAPDFDVEGIRNGRWLEKQKRDDISLPAPSPGGSGNTTHFSIMDEEGNVVALTQTIQSFFGSGIMVPELGMILNNELADFSFRKGAINAPAAGKIPRSSMSPTIVLKDGRPVGAIGSPGGERIPGAVVQVLLQKIDFGLSLKEAMAAPRIFNDGPRGCLHYESEIPRERMEQVLELLARDGRIPKLEERGPMDRFFGGIHALWRMDDEGLDGAGDPRRDGFVGNG